MSIYKKLIKIQQKINGLSKDKKAFGYDYVTGGKILSFVKPIMNELGVLLKQEVISIDNERQDYSVPSKKWVKDTTGKSIQEEFEKPKNEILSKVMMRFTWVDSETGETDVNLFGANGMNGWDKGVGSALTYGERYFLLKYFHIATDEDDVDNPAINKEELPKELLKDSQFEAVLNSKNKKHAAFFLERFEMTSSQVEAFKKIINN